jgi:hypothetical protein
MESTERERDSKTSRLCQKLLMRLSLSACISAFTILVQIIELFSLLAVKRVKIYQIQLVFNQSNFSIQKNKQSIINL